MSHRHFCDFSGHYWDCPGTAVRLFQSEASVCMCLTHGVPMEEGDHSECSVELLACPEHRDEQMRAMGHEPGFSEEPPAPSEGSSSLFIDEDGNPIAGFCLWCDVNFYTLEESEKHTANNMVNCPVFQALKDTGCDPPVLHNLFEKAGLLDNDQQPTESRNESDSEEEK